MGLQLATEADSLKYFPASNSSREVRDRMLAACQGLGVRVQCKAQVTGISRDAESPEWRLRLEDGSEHCSARIASPCSLATRPLCMLCMLCPHMHAECCLVPHDLPGSPRKADCACARVSPPSGAAVLDHCILRQFRYSSGNSNRRAQLPKDGHGWHWAPPCAAAWALHAPCLPCPHTPEGQPPGW